MALDRSGRPASDGTVSPDAANGLAARLRSLALSPDSNPEQWVTDLVWLLLPCHARVTLQPMLVSLAIDSAPFRAITASFQDVGLCNPGDIVRQLRGIVGADGSPAPYGCPDTMGAGEAAATAPHADSLRALLQGTGYWQAALAAFQARGSRHAAPAMGPDSDQAQDDRCGICLQRHSANLPGWPSCGHAFCADCAAQWAAVTPEHAAPTCPICRTPARIGADGHLAPVYGSQDGHCSRCQEPCPADAAEYRPGISAVLCARCAAPADDPSDGEADDASATRAGGEAAEPAAYAPRPRQAAGNGGGRAGVTRVPQAPASRTPAPGAADAVGTLFDPSHLNYLAQSVDHRGWTDSKELHHALLRTLILQTNPVAIVTREPAQFLDLPDLATLDLQCLAAQPAGYTQARRGRTETSATPVMPPSSLLCIPLVPIYKP